MVATEELKKKRKSILALRRGLGFLSTTMSAATMAYYLKNMAVLAALYYYGNTPVTRNDMITTDADIVRTNNILALPGIGNRVIDRRVEQLQHFDRRQQMYARTRHDLMEMRNEQMRTRTAIRNALSRNTNIPTDLHQSIIDLTVPSYSGRNNNYRIF